MDNEGLKIRGTEDFGKMFEAGECTFPNCSHAGVRHQHDVSVWSNTPPNKPTSLCPDHGLVEKDHKCF